MLQENNNFKVVFLINVFLHKPCRKSLHVAQRKVTKEKNRQSFLFLDPLPIFLKDTSNIVQDLVISSE